MGLPLLEPERVPQPVPPHGLQVANQRQAVEDFVGFVGGPSRTDGVDDLVFDAFESKDWDFPLALSIDKIKLEVQ